jgi:hypothetical protein
MRNKCSLLVVDRGNRLIRQISLTPKDCADESPQSGQFHLLLDIIIII